MKLIASGILYCNFGRCVVRNVVGNDVLAYRIQTKSESRMTLKQECLLQGRSRPQERHVVGNCLILAAVRKIVEFCSESAPVPIPRHTGSKFRATRQFGGVSKAGTDGS